MVSSRTGTAKWLRVAKQRLDHDREVGLTRCPRCRVGLDWLNSRQPNSPEPDHIIPHAQGGTDTFENTRTICRRCNQQLGGMLNKKAPRAPVKTVDLEVSSIW